MKELHILLGFEEPEFEKGLISYLQGCSYKVNVSVRYSKLAIKEYVRNNPSCNTVVLKETMQNGSYYSAEEIAELTDDRDVNVIVVVNGRNYGTHYMETLYAAGITSGFLQQGRKGARPKEIAELIINKRSRKEARVYYGLAEKKIELGFLDNETFTEYYTMYLYGAKHSSNIESFMNVCSLMSPQKIADFIKKFPEKELEEFYEYEEFHTIISLVRKCGIRINVKKPRKLRAGVPRPQTPTLEDYVAKHSDEKNCEEHTESDELSMEDFCKMLTGERKVQDVKRDAPDFLFGAQTSVASEQAASGKIDSLKDVYRPIKEDIEPEGESGAVENPSVPEEDDDLGVLLSNPDYDEQMNEQILRNLEHMRGKTSTRSLKRAWIYIGIAIIVIAMLCFSIWFLYY